MAAGDEPTKPSEVDDHISWFNRFAGRAGAFVSRAPFFAFCLLLVLTWTAGLPIAGASNQLYHLVLNSPTTAITFLLMPLLLNTQARFEQATNKKLNAIAESQANLIEWQARHAASEEDCTALLQGAHELRSAVGLEHRETT